MKRLFLSLLLLVNFGCAVRPPSAPDEAKQVSLKGLRGHELIVALNPIVKQKRVLSYDAARDAMFARQPVYCFYSGIMGLNIHNRYSATLEGFNAEHVWPQSLGTATGSQHSDLHHLRPCLVKENSRRGNRAFGVDYQPEDEVKGEIARTMFYMWLRYGNDLDARNFKKERRYLIDWNKKYSVTKEERERNEWVEDLQGNRNPFVDDRGLVSSIEL